MQTHVKPLPILGEKEASFDPTTYALRLVICVAYKLVGGTRQSEVAAVPQYAGKAEYTAQAVQYRRLNF